MILLAMLQGYKPAHAEESRVSMFMTGSYVQGYTTGSYVRGGTVERRCFV